MRTIFGICIALLSLMVVTGCIVSDRTTTLIMKPDGSADVVTVRTNIHFKGESKKKERKLNTFRENFDHRDQWWFHRVKQAGGEIEEARWIRKRGPMAHYMKGHLPDEKGIEGFFTFKKGGWDVSSDLQYDGSNRTFTITVTPPGDKSLSLPPAKAAQLRKKIANGFSHTRIAIERGKVTEANGLIVADDGQSAMVDRAQIPDQLWKKNETVEISLSWRHR